MLEHISHPGTIILVQAIIITFINGFTTPRSRLRLSFGFPITCILALCSVISSHAKPGSNPLKGTLGAVPVGLMLQYIDTALVGKWNITDGGPRRIVEERSRHQSLKANEAIPKSKQLPLDTGVRSRFLFGLKSVCDIRGTNTAWESRSVAPFSNTDPDWVPGRAQFLATTTIKLVACYLISSSIKFHTMGQSASQKYAQNEINIIDKISRLSMDQMLTRFTATTKRFAMIICSLEMAFDVVAIPAVAFDILPVRDFRPLFNSPLEAYTVRRFWSPFFHQIWRRRFLSIAAVIVYDWFELPKKSLAARYLSTLTVFLLSGLLHYSEDVAAGLPWTPPGAIILFVAQFGAIIIEDFLSWLLNLRDRQPGLLMKLPGYFWVLLYLAIAGPYWVYPRLEASLK